MSLFRRTPNTLSSGLASMVMRTPLRSVQDLCRDVVNDNPSAYDRVTLQNEEVERQMLTEKGEYMRGCFG